MSTLPVRVCVPTPVSQLPEHVLHAPQFMMQLTGGHAAVSHVVSVCVLTDGHAVPPFSGSWSIIMSRVRCPNDEQSPVQLDHAPQRHTQFLGTGTQSAVVHERSSRSGDGHGSPPFKGDVKTMRLRAWVPGDSHTLPTLVHSLQADH